MKQLENSVVQLIPMETCHIEGINKAAKDESIWTHMSVDLTQYSDVVTYVEAGIKKREEGREFPFVIFNKKEQQIIGCTWFLDVDLTHKRLEIGSTWLHPHYWRSAINTNCKYLLLSYCFEELKLNRVQIKTGHENLQSQQAIERIGAKKEGVLRNHMIRRNGEIRHTVMYSVTIEDWLEIKKHLEENLLK